MQVYFVTLGKGLQGPARMNGALVLGDQGLHFLCSSLGRTGSNDLSRFGAVGSQLEQYRTKLTPPTFSEAELRAVISTVEHSFTLAPDQIEVIARSFCAGSKIVQRGGAKLVVWNPGFAGQFRDQAKAWSQANGVRTEGL